MNMSNKMYDTLKWIAQYLLPAISALYAGLAQIWNLPYGVEIAGTVAAIDTFLGVMLGISTAQYNKAQAAQQVTANNG
ncbi:MAG: phage holin [Clostridia bacterium]|nr:phage holin [Clostridia bacterium]